MKKRSYAEYMELGRKAMNKGDYVCAAMDYDNAYGVAPDTRARADAMQMLGIVERLARRLGESESDLTKSREIAAITGDKQLMLRIDRNLAMTLMERLKPGNEALFNRIERLLDRPKQLFEDPDEYWVNVGFIGRAYLLCGERGEARQALESADDYLRSSGNRTYELNNLLWLMMVLPVRDRYGILKRANQLVAAAEQPRHKYSPLIITIGGRRLYRLVARLKQLLKRLRRHGK